MAKIGNDRDLAYWLQGYFEINGTDELSSEQTKQIALRINEMPEQGDLAKFVLRQVLEGGFDGQGPAIAQKLNDTFIHAIDPTIAGDQNELRDIHKGRKPGSGDGPKFEAMC